MVGSTRSARPTVLVVGDLPSLPTLLARLAAHGIVAFGVVDPELAARVLELGDFDVTLVDASVGLDGAAVLRRRACIAHGEAAPSFVMIPTDLVPAETAAAAGWSVHDLALGATELPADLLELTRYRRERSVTEVPRRAAPSWRVSRRTAVAI